MPNILKYLKHYETIFGIHVYTYIKHYTYGNFLNHKELKQYIDQENNSQYLTRQSSFATGEYVSFMLEQ